MHKPMIFVAWAVLMVLPGALAAAQGGFVTGINPNFAGSAPVGVTHGTLVQPQVPLPPGISVTVPRHPGRGSYVSTGQHISVVPPRGTRVAPGFETAPDTSETRVTSRGRRPLDPKHGFQPHFPVQFFGVVPFVPLAPIAVGTGPGHFPIILGMPRADVIQHLGRPSVTILRPGAETLVFSNTTIVIENGVVAVIR